MEGVVGLFDPFEHVAFDTSVFIFQFETHPDFGGVADDILQSVSRGRFQGSASVLALTELATLPYRYGDSELARAYGVRLRSIPNFRVVNLGPEIAMQAARIRGMYNIALPDAVHLATALEADADTFITNDRRLRSFPELPVTVLADLAH